MAKYDEAASAFQKHLDINPTDERANDYLGLALERHQKYAEAIAAFRKQTEMNPLDVAAHAALGEIFLEQHEYAQAAPELDKATILSPGNVELQVNLGRAYLNTNEKEKALAAFEKAVALSPTPLVRNDIAYNLADAKVELDKAQEYASSAVSSIATDLRNVDLQHLTANQLNEVTNIAACWDTLGWIYFHKGDYGSAERYVRAAWLLDQHGEVGDHLAQIYDKLGQKDRAIHAFALALAAPNSVPETRARLTLLLGGNSQIDELVSKAKPDLAALRTIPAGKLLNEDAQGDFFVLLSPVGKEAHVNAVRFVAGSEKLRPLADRLRSLDFGSMFPDASPIKLIRRGTLTCSAKMGDCVFILAIPQDAKVN
jgi:tetratricopeptide (TPR) repeat protein